MVFTESAAQGVFSYSRVAERRRLSPRLRGWLRGVSLRATSPVAAASNEEMEAAAEAERNGEGRCLEGGGVLGIC